MQKIRPYVLFTVHVLILVMVCSEQPLCQMPADDLLQRRLIIKIDEVPFITVVATLSVEHKIPVGLELATISYDGVNRSIDVSNAPLEEILNLFAGIGEPIGGKW